MRDRATESSAVFAFNGASNGASNAGFAFNGAFNAAVATIPGPAPGSSRAQKVSHAMFGSPTMRTVLFSLLVVLVALPAIDAAGAVPDGTSNTLMIGEKRMRCARVQPDPQTLRSGGPGSLRIWVTVGLFEVVREAAAQKQAEVRLVSNGPAGHVEVRLFDVTLEPAPLGAGSRVGSSSRTTSPPAQGFGPWEVNFRRILVSGAALPGPGGRR